MTSEILIRSGISNCSFPPQFLAWASKTCRFIIKQGFTEKQTSIDSGMDFSCYGWCWSGFGALSSEFEATEIRSFAAMSVSLRRVKGVSMRPSFQQAHPAIRAAGVPIIGFFGRIALSGFYSVGHYCRGLYKEPSRHLRHRPRRLTFSESRLF